MRSLLIFISETLYNEEPGFLYGRFLQDNKKNISKFYLLGSTKSVHYISQFNNDIIPLGYFHGPEKKKEYWEKKLSNWIEIYVIHNKNLSYEYSIKNIWLENQKLNMSSFHLVLIIYDSLCLLNSELYLKKNSQDYHTELREILSKESEIKKDRLHNAVIPKIKQLIFTSLILLFLYPVSFLYKIANFLKPVIKHSSLGLHCIAWFNNAKWTLSTLLLNKKFTFKTTNCIIAVAIDMTLGILLIKLLLNFLEESSLSEVLLLKAEKVVEFLKGLVNWLMGSPAGLKLNPSFNNILGKFFLYHIHLWWAFLVVSKPLMELAFKVLLFFGKLGVTFQISIIADLLALVSFHTYCIYVYAARLFNIQVRGLTALFRLFLGKKTNPLRKRVDSCYYQPDQLFVGTLLFTILLFLMPTTWVYYIVFTTLRLLMIGFGGFLTRLKFYLQIMPIYVFILWIFQTIDLSGSIGIKLLSRKMKGPIILKTESIVAPWNDTWQRSIPEPTNIYPPIKWNNIVSNVLWGQLLYPF